MTYAFKSPFTVYNAIDWTSTSLSNWIYETIQINSVNTHLTFHVLSLLEAIMKMDVNNERICLDVRNYFIHVQIYLRFRGHRARYKCENVANERYLKWGLHSPHGGSCNVYRACSPGGGLGIPPNMVGWSERIW